MAGFSSLDNLITNVSSSGKFWRADWNKNHATAGTVVAGTWQGLIGGAGNPPANTTLGGTTHITQSRVTVSRTLNATVAGAVLKDFRQAINVTRDGGEGCDLVPPTFEFSRTVRRETVTDEYMDTLVRLTGTVNVERFYNRGPGEVLYIGCEGQYAQDSRWTITHRFHANKSLIDYVVARSADGTPELTVPAVSGWEYLWVQYIEVLDGGFRIRKPVQANVEQVYEYADFADLEVGGT